MKTLYLIRHAKSSWSDPDLSDLERPLNKRGLRDAPFMAKLLSGNDVLVDKLVSSPAKRALETAGYFAKQWKISSDDIALDRRVYEATPHTLLELVRGFSNDWDVVFLYGHNPTFTSFINFFAKEYMANLPTCGIACLTTEAGTWADLTESNTVLSGVFYPRQYFPKGN